MKHIIISGLNLHDNNRGTAALGYGAFQFLEKYHRLNEYQVINIVFYKNFIKYWGSKESVVTVNIGNEKRDLKTYYISYFEWFFAVKCKFRLPFGKLNTLMKNVEYVAAINGGDGFSDIYSRQTFENRLVDTRLAMSYKISLIILPQTLGPFSEASNYNTAKKILQYASKVYVRDLNFIADLKRMNVKYELSKDLSYFMQPQRTALIEVLPDAVGLNISGLAYSNGFKTLSGRFEQYPLLINRIIENFQEMQVPVYLISHSYNYCTPESNNDDMEASRHIYLQLKNKENVYLIDLNLSSPETKYIISKFDFFIGTRMHANFAAIYTQIPVFGLAYSYKFKGAFDENGLVGHYADIIDIEDGEISKIISKIDYYYHVRNETKKLLAR